MAYIGTSPSNGVRRIHTYTATAGQEIFTGSSTEGVTLTYADTNYIDVFQNGVLLGSADYTSTSGTSVVLAQGASVSDLVVIVVYDVFSVADTVSKTSGGSFDSAVTISGALSSKGGAVFNEDSVDVDFRVESNGNANMLFVDGGNNHVNIGSSSDAGGVLNVSDGTSFSTGITVENTGDTHGSVIDFLNNSDSPADGDYIGGLIFKETNSASGTHQFAKIFGIATDITDGTEDGALTFETSAGGANTAERMRIQGSSGNVGIGTTSPSANLESEGNVSSTTQFSGFQGLRIQNANGSAHGVTADINFVAGTGSNNRGAVIGAEFVSSGGNDLYFATNGSNVSSNDTPTERMRIDSSGNLGLNTGSSTGRATGIGMEILHVGTDTSATLRLTGENGSSAETFSEITHVGDSRLLNFKHNGATRIQIDANGSVLVDGGSVGSVSDSRVKKDVEDLSDGLSIVKQLRPVKFKYKGNTEYYNGDDKTYHGFIADEVKAIAPQYITEVTNKIYDDEFDGTNIVDFDEELKDKKFTSVDDFKTMSQTDLIPMLVKAIQELEARITTLEGA